MKHYDPYDKRASKFARDVVTHMRAQYDLADDAIVDSIVRALKAPTPTKKEKKR